MKKGKINLPSNFNAPENYKTDEFYFAVLEPSITEIDYQAVMSSRKNLRKIFSANDAWPSDSMTIEENTQDLIRHESEFRQKKAFAYSVFTTNKNEYIGCVYIKPKIKNDFDCEVYLWVKDSRNALDQKLFQEIKKWLLGYWNLNAVAFPGRDISWNDW